MPFASRRRICRAPWFLACAALSLASVPALADSTGLFLPGQPSGPGGEDTIKSATGTSCSQSLNSSGPYLDLGIAVHNDDDRSLFELEDEDEEGVNALGYVRIVIPLEKAPKRIDCARLYEMELDRLRQEVELLRMGIE